MEWTQFAVFLISMGGMFMWLKSDIKDIKTEASADRRDILQLIRCIHEEIKDFHGRLCTLEERKRNNGK